MRYFKDRKQAGEIIAKDLIQYKSSNTSVVALNEGAVIIGEVIAKELNSTLFMLVTDDVFIPGESEPFATLSSANTYTYNKTFSTGQIESFESDYHSYIDQRKEESFHRINRIIGQDGDIDKRLLKRHVVIIVSDGLKNGRSLDVVADFFKPVKLEKMIAVTPIATIQAVDKMHTVADEIRCLSVVENYVSTDHYYEDNRVPNHDEVVKIMKDVVFQWK